MNNYYSANSSFCFTWLDPTVCVDLGNRFRTTQCIYCRRAKKKSICLSRLNHVLTPIAQILLSWRYLQVDIHLKTRPSKSLTQNAKQICATASSVHRHLSKRAHIHRHILPLAVPPAIQFVLRWKTATAGTAVIPSPPN